MPVGESSRPYVVCPVCGHAFRATYASTYITVGREADLLKVFRKGQPPWLGFHAAEVCGKERSLRSRELGDLCLRASWVCRKEKERPFESTFQLRALRHFMRSLQEDD